MTTCPVVHRFVMLLSAGALVAAGVAVGSLSRRGELPRVLAATAAADDAFAVCTTAVGEGFEGVFLLDFTTGDLTGGVLNRSTAKFAMTYRYNVLKDLDFKAGKAKNPKFLLTAGIAEFAGNAGSNMGGSVLYVTDAATGVTVAYGIPWNAQQAAAGGGVNTLVPLDKAQPRGGKAP